MFVFLVTGPCGAGKSTLARRMAEWGHQTLSADGDPVLSGWTDPRGARVDRPDLPDVAWLTSHEWRWDPDRLDDHIANAAGADATALWIFGQASNAMTMLDRFDAVFLLDVDPATVSARLRNPSRGNDFGSVGDSFRIAIEAIPQFRADWLAAGSIAIDATRPVDEVGQDLLTEAAGAALRLAVAARQRTSPS